MVQMINKRYERDDATISWPQKNKYANFFPKKNNKIKVLCETRITWPIYRTFLPSKPLGQHPIILYECNMTWKLDSK